MHLNTFIVKLINELAQTNEENDNNRFQGNTTCIRTIVTQKSIDKLIQFGKALLMINVQVLIIEVKRTAYHAPLASGNFIILLSKNVYVLKMNDFFALEDS